VNQSKPIEANDPPMNLLAHNPDKQLSAKAKVFLARPKKPRT
jgi:hypothetical protein